MIFAICRCCGEFVPLVEWPPTCVHCGGVFFWFIRADPGYWDRKFAQPAPN